MAQRAPRKTPPKLTAVPNEPKETMRQLTAAELEYLRAAQMERDAAAQALDAAYARSASANAAFQSFTAFLTRKYEANPEAEMIDTATGRITPIMPPSTTEEIAEQQDATDEPTPAE